MSAFRRRTVSILPGIAAILAVTACSDDAPSSTSSSASLDLTKLQACELLTPGEIEAATGLSAEPGEDMTQLDGKLPMCSWASTEGGSLWAANVMVTGTTYTDYDQFVRLATGGSLGFDLDEIERVDGVGRFGVWLPDVKMLQVYGDDVMVQMGVEVADGRDPVEAAKALAQLALDRVR